MLFNNFSIFVFKINPFKQMKNKYFFLLSIVSLIVIFTFNHCNLDGTCYQQYEVPVIRFELPDSAPVNTKIETNVTYVNYNNCQKFDMMLDATSEDTISVHVICFVEDCNCQDRIPDSIASYSFTRKAAGTYYLRMVKYDKTILEDSIIVYQ